MPGEEKKFPAEGKFYPGNYNHTADSEPFFPIDDIPGEQEDTVENQVLLIQYADAFRRPGEPTNAQLRVPPNYQVLPPPGVKGFKKERLEYFLNKYPDRPAPERRHSIG
jgi:hypothetical protein